MENNFDFRSMMQSKTKQFALRVIQLYKTLPRTDEAYILGKQLLRSATSVGANYRASCRARSAKEFYSKISIVIEEADESMFWLELLVESEIVDRAKVNDLYLENEEILKILVAARKSFSHSRQL